VEKFTYRDAKSMTVIGAGLVTVDIIQETSSDWVPIDRPPVYSSGGTVCNILCHLAHAGWNTHLLGAVGDDDMADILLGDLRRFGVNCSAVVSVPNTSTRRILHKIVSYGWRKGQHKFELTCSKCHRTFPPVTQPTFSTLAPFLAGKITNDTALIIDRANDLTAELVEKVADLGGVTIFEPGYLPDRSPENVTRILNRVDILKYSHELSWSRRPFHSVVQSSSMPNVKVIIETRGQSGVQIVRSNRRKRLVAQPMASIRDGSGAGDAFMAGFLLGLGPDRLQHLGRVTDIEIESAAGRGQARGGLACMFLGSKGLLYCYDHDAIGVAVEAFAQTLKPPDGFGQDLLTGAACTVAQANENLCAVCRL
jgi:sugar/nucleoside kinase (ribokinase family)